MSSISWSYNCYVETLRFSLANLGGHSGFAPVTGPYSRLSGDTFVESVSEVVRKLARHMRRINLSGWLILSRSSSVPNVFFLWVIPPCCLMATGLHSFFRFDKLSGSSLNHPEFFGGMLVPLFLALRGYFAYSSLCCAIRLWLLRQRVWRAIGVLSGKV